jgi:hypothetical protein
MPSAAYEKVSYAVILHVHAAGEVASTPPEAPARAQDAQVDADALKLGGGGALAFCADRGSCLRRMGEA